MTAQRRLAAILVADVVGYSKLVAGDETGTLARLSALKRDIFLPAIARHSGRLFKTVGDGFLVEFASAVQAVAAAQAVQHVSADGTLPLRIGIHVGDVIVDGDDLMGDGVNIAARIEGIAEAGGIAISRAVHEQVRDKIDVSFVDKGEIEMKNLAHPVHVFAVAGPRTVPAPAPILALPDKPSIAVLPFQNMSGDPEQEYFADGMVEDIITALSRFKSLFVIARNSSFTYKGKAVDIKQVGRELGVRYILEGSVRSAAARVRITGQLIDAETGNHLWADRFDGTLEDVFDLQDKVTVNVVTAIAPEVDRAEMERMRRKAPANLTVYDLMLRAMARRLERTAESRQEALAIYRRVIALDPEHGAAYAGAAHCYAALRQLGHGGDIVAEQAEVRALVAKAKRLAPDDPRALHDAAFALLVVCDDRAGALTLIDEALALNPNLVAVLGMKGWICLWTGQLEPALALLQRAIRLGPRDPDILQFWRGVAAANALLGRYEESIEAWRKVLSYASEDAGALRGLAIALALAGDLQEARRYTARVLAADPDVRLSRFEHYYALRRAEDVELIKRGLRLAGFPE